MGPGSYIQDIYLHDLCLQEGNQNLKVPRMASNREEHIRDVLRRRNGDQPHIAFAEINDQQVTECNIQGPMRHSFVIPSCPS